MPALKIYEGHTGTSFPFSFKDYKADKSIFHLIHQNVTPFLGVSFPSMSVWGGEKSVFLCLEERLFLSLQRLAGLALAAGSQVSSGSGATGVQVQCLS